jgi:carbon monoxide dehydrogenase subunit G
MKLEQSFAVRAPIERVWEALVDVQRVAPCLPGAEITDAGEDRTYRGNFTVKLGPTTAAYRGELRIEETDEAAHRATMRASGQDKRGQGSAKASIVSVLREEGDATRVDVETDFTITGRLARFGRGGMIRDISNRLLRDFATCLQETIEAAPADAAAAAALAGAAGGPPSSEAPPGSPSSGPPAAGPAPGATGGPPAADPEGIAEPGPATAPPAKPIRGISLFLSVLWERIKRLFGRRSS